VQTSFPRTLIAGAALATVVGLLVSLVSGYSVMRTLDDSHGKVSRLLTLRSEILLHDETLTASTLLAASTGDQRWINRYRQIEPQLGAAIDATIALADDALVDQAAQRTEQANNALVDLEEQALSLVANGQSEAAMGLIQSPCYERYKSAYILGMDSLSEHVEASAATASLAVAGTRRVALVAGLVTLTLLVVLWIAVLHRLGVWRAELDREARRRVQAESDVRSLAAGLETKVSERTRELELSQVRLKHQVDVDELTGLASRSAGVQALQERLQRVTDTGERVAIASIDLRGFGEINEAFGHTVGDDLLQQCSARLRQRCHERGSLARLGGDEFLMVCSLGADEDSADLQRRASAAFEAPFLLGEGAGCVAVVPAIGIAIGPEHGDDSHRLLRSADLAMHRAKSSRESSAVVFDLAIRQEREVQREIEEGLRRALSNDNLRLFYQPKFDLQSGALVGAEALLRWVDPQLGSVRPDIFIPVAERTGLIVAIGDWVIHEASRQMAAWQQELGLALSVAVNVSPLQFQQGDIVQVLRSALQANDLTPSCLQVELTESALLGDDTRTHELIGRIAELGCELALDDFGTGYSALGYLRRYPFNILKIDRSFVCGMLDSERDASLTHAIVDMAHSLGMRVVAEGVELPGQRDALRLFSCDLAQGYLFSKPLPADEFSAFAIDQSPDGAAQAA